jgi:hypothetical protein
MLDLLLLRNEKGTEVLVESQKRRYKSTDIVEKCMDLDKKWKEGNY